MLKTFAVENATRKSLRSPGFNFDFSKVDGRYQCWGANYEDDAEFSPVGPVLLDVEAVTGWCPNAAVSCRSTCYKSNTAAPGKVMTLATLRQILDKLPRVTGVMPVCQIAYGITGVKSNPEFLDMLRLTRSYGIVPNFTLTGMDLDDEFAEQAAKLVGAVAVSAYANDKNVCYNTVRKFLDLGVKQTNIHLLFHQDNLDFVYEVLGDIESDPRLRGLNACILLGLKPRGRATKMRPLEQVRFNDLVSYAMAHKLPLGFDSCSASKFGKWVEQSDISELEKTWLNTISEPCESFGLFSAYINVDGMYFPCSFAEGEGEWRDDISVLDCNDFLSDIWFSDKVNAWREKSLENQRRCLLFEIDY
jgi:hypothetical protein